ncbi:Mur ligase family protein [Tropheryma whipplei]|uniref:Mur ligase family protein n=1 Tax=Tropheryma whipplei TaxID=2039 RepID=UPI001F4CC55E|nr:UDP-N-acetylmuramyl-tripeptide synthetase [Tropheryma whipplei]
MAIFVTLQGKPYRLSDLIKQTGVRLTDCSNQFSDRFVSGITQIAQSVERDDIFVAFQGKTRHGVEFLDQVQSCAAVLTDNKGRHIMQSDCLPTRSTPILVTDSPRSDLIVLAKRVYPIDDIRIFGITGTNGKTSTMHIAAKLLEMMGISCGISTTIGSSASESDSCLTTPELCQLYARIFTAKQARADFFALEASSHAINRGRLGDIVLEVAAFTNLTPEHMEEHKNMEAYYQAKKALFLNKRSNSAVINIDTPYGIRLFKETGCSASVISENTKYGLDHKLFWQASVRRVGLSFGFTLISPSGYRVESSISLLGKAFALNTCMAIVILCNLGIDIERIDSVLRKAGGLKMVLPGRMEVFQTGNSPRVIVDHGHTVDAVETALVAAKSITRGRLITIINADGQRDPSKRKHLGQLCGAYSDKLFITDGHSRFENPAEIRRMILDGVEGPRRQVEQIPSMTQAVLAAIDIARSDDTVLCSGFGDDPYLDVLGKKIPYSLRDEVRRGLERFAQGT